MKRPDDLKPFPVADAIRPGTITMTMSEGQWDATLLGAYDAGLVLLELDDNEVPVRAYRKPQVVPS